MDDFILLDEQLTMDEKMLRENVRHFVDQDVIPFVADAYEKAEFLPAWRKRLAELGLLGVTIPTEYGGSGIGAVGYGLICQELERGDSSLRSFVSVQNSLCAYAILAYGSDAQKQALLPKLASGEMIACFALTEANAGSDPNSMQTRAEPVTGGYQLNGSKCWITNGTIADIAVVWAKTAQGIRGFIVGKENFQAKTIHHKLSLRASTTSELNFDSIFVAKENLLPGSERGLVAALDCLTQARYGIAWGAMGAAQACYEIALAYVSQRQQFQKPLAAKQLIQYQLVDMLNEIVKAQTLNYHFGRLKEQGKLSYTQVSLAKMNATREALKIARQARNILGANGITLDYHVMRHANNLETVFTYEGADNVHHLIVGKAITGVDAF